jgi:cobalamin biosynthesis Co2+ chelatase CbiK
MNISPILENYINEYEEATKTIKALEESLGVTMYKDALKKKEDIEKKIKKDFTENNTTDIGENKVSDHIRFVVKQTKEYSPREVIKVFGEQGYQVLSVSATKIKELPEYERVQPSIKKSFVFYFS